MVNRDELMRTKTLEEAITLLFNRVSNGRNYILSQEAMTGSVASEYDYLGKSGRQETYRKLAEDFKRRTGCYGMNHPRTQFNLGPILEVGCGSGLLTLELAEQTNSDNIIGLDLSEDMIKLAQSNLSRRSKERTEEIKEFWKRLPQYCKPGQEDYKKLEQIPPLFDRVQYVQGSVYDLDKAGFQDINYIVCRNALHRFQYPGRAIKQMCQVLSTNGQLYIGDLRRDANWQIVLERIGEKRWQTKTLVEDYVAAMASMLTMEELEQTLDGLGIQNYQIISGDYSTSAEAKPGQMKEFAPEVEYICIIQK